MRILRLGPIHFGFDWSWDCHWDFNSTKGYRYEDFFAFGRVCRDPDIHIFRLILGPLMLAVGWR